MNVSNDTVAMGLS